MHDTQAKNNASTSQSYTPPSNEAMEIRTGNSKRQVVGVGSKRPLAESKFVIASQLANKSNS